MFFHTHCALPFWFRFTDGMTVFSRHRVEGRALEHAFVDVCRHKVTTRTHVRMLAGNKVFLIRAEEVLKAMRDKADCVARDLKAHGYTVKYAEQTLFEDSIGSGILQRFRGATSAGSVDRSLVSWFIGSPIGLSGAWPVGHSVCLECFLA